MYIQRLGITFGIGSSFRNSLRVPQLNTFPLQRLKKGGIMIFRVKLENSQISSS